MMYYKVYDRYWGKVVAVCDKELCNKTLKEKDLEFFVNPRFYKGKEGDIETVMLVLREAASVNLIGKEAVKCGIDIGLVNEKNIVTIEKIPHAQAVVMKF